VTFQPGQEVELREVWDGRTWELRTGIVVRDHPNVIAVSTPAGSRALVATGPDGARLRLPPDQWEMAEATIPGDRSFLAVHPVGANHSTILIRDGSGKLLRWYINLETALRRTAAGFEYTDHFLDVVAEADLSSWRWKDEDELAEAVERRLVTAAQAREYYAEGERAIAWLQARRTPYDEAWEEWEMLQT
jgi:predicted RNA-binding protein associated with RNAse of E/G family